MTKTVRNERKRDTEKAFFTKKAAEIAGVSVREVRYVLDMERNNPKAITAYMELSQRFNKLMDEVRRIMPDVCTENGPLVAPNGAQMRAN